MREEREEFYRRRSEAYLLRVAAERELRAIRREVMLAQVEDGFMPPSIAKLLDSIDAYEPDIRQ